MRTRTLLGLGAILFMAGVLAFLSLNSRAADEKDGWRPLVPESALAQLVKDDTEVVSRALKADKPAAKDIKLAKVAAMMLAIYGEASGKIGHHSQAMKVIEALNKDDGVKEAKDAAEKLKSPGAGGDKGDPLKAVWDEANKAYDKDLAMQLFKGTRAGGLGYEKSVKELSEKTPSPKDLPNIATLAYKTAMFTQALGKIGPTKSEGGQKTPENWIKFASDLQKAALETGEAAAKKNAAAAKTGLSRMDKACVNCHEVFK